MDIGTCIVDLYYKDISHINNTISKEILLKKDIHKAKFNHPMEPVHIWYDVSNNIFKI